MTPCYNYNSTIVQRSRVSGFPPKSIFNTLPSAAIPWYTPPPRSSTFNAKSTSNKTSPGNTHGRTSSGSQSVDNGSPLQVTHKSRCSIGWATSCIRLPLTGGLCVWRHMRICLWLCITLVYLCGGSRRLRWLCFRLPVGTLSVLKMLWFRLSLIPR